MNAIITGGSTKLERQVKCLEDDVMTLTSAIEVAIIKGQKSLDPLSDTPESDVVFDEDSALTRAGARPGVIGWIDDF